MKKPTISKRINLNVGDKRVRYIEELLNKISVMLNELASFKEDKIALTAPELDDNDNLDAEEGAYYRFGDTIDDDITISLPPSDSLACIMLLAEIGQGSITFSAESPILYQEGYVDEGGLIEFNCLFNGVEWVVTSTKIETT